MSKVKEDFLVLDKIAALMDEKNIRIEYLVHYTLVTIGDRQYHLIDADSGRTVDEFPPALEYKLRPVK